MSSHPESSQTLCDLTLQALQLRSTHKYALHPVEAVVQYFCTQAESSGQESNGRICFKEAETQYRAGTQGLRLSEIPQLPQQLRELSRLASLDHAGRKAVRNWAQNQSYLIDEDQFFKNWNDQGKRGGAEHQV